MAFQRACAARLREVIVTPSIVSPTQTPFVKKSSAKWATVAVPMEKRSVIISLQILGRVNNILQDITTGKQSNPAQSQSLARIYGDGERW